MKSKSQILSSLILSVGVALMGYFIKDGIVNFKNLDRAVSVKGLSERSVEADNVIWPLQYALVGDNLLELYASIETKNAQIIAFLEKNGIARADISIPQPEVFDAYADRYINKSELRARYNISSTVTVSSGEVARVRAAMGKVSDLIKQGIALKTDQYGDGRVIFSYNSLNLIKPAMIEEATKSARAAAEKFASDSQSKLGKIKHASQGQFSISTPDINAPHIKVVRVVTTVNYSLKD